MSQIQVTQKPSGKVAKQVLSSQIIFKYINIAVLLVLVFCINGFLQFRQYCVLKGYYVFLTESLIWCGIGFFGIFIVKYSYYHFFESTIESIVHSKYVGQERVHKANLVKKLSFDSVFYSSTTILAYCLFKQEYWFPSIIGGCGECGAIYRQYPNWPLNSVSKLEMYYMIQLGIHIFSVFQMAVIKRKTQRKLYQYLLHHSVAASLILFSMMCNEVSAGATILIIHDMSDIFIAFGRAYVQTKYDTKPLVITLLYISTITSWIYLRIIVFPFCILANVYANKPTSKDEWFIISFQYSYLLSVAFVLYGMHIFWTYFLIKIGVVKASGKYFKNVHDQVKQT